MSSNAQSQQSIRGISPVGSNLGSYSAGASLAADLEQVILVGLAPSIASHLMEPIRAVVQNAAILMMRRADLGMPRSFPAGTLLVLQDQQADENGLETLRLLRAEGVSTPAILIITGNDFICPRDVEQLGDLDVLPLAEFSRFAFRRSLILLGARAARDQLMDEVASRVRAYERVLAAKDEERQRVLNVAQSLEHRLSSVEEHSQRSEATWAGRLARAEARVRELEGQLAGEVSPPVTLAKRGSSTGESRGAQSSMLPVADVRQVRVSPEQELKRAAKVEKIGNLIARLKASERVRTAQTQEILGHQRRIAELEQHLETIAALVESEQQTARVDPAALLEKLGARLMQVDRVRSDQQETIDRLSHSLAVQQVDEALDHGEARRNVVQRVEEVIQRARRFDRQLICLMIGLDDPLTLRQTHGAVSFDFILVQIAQRLHLTLRRGDVVMRYGAGEFLLISDAETTEQARSQAARLIRTVCAEPLELGGKQINISLSTGILAFRHQEGGAHELLRRARGGLVAAQARGERQIYVQPAETLPAALPSDEVGSQDLTA
ncbi:MAG: diguanylate cyclase [Acidobacteriota bacterium]